jgi:hypothetical protein
MYVAGVTVAAAADQVIMYQLHQHSSHASVAMPCLQTLFNVCS